MRGSGYRSYRLSYRLFSTTKIESFFVNSKTREVNFNHCSVFALNKDILSQINKGAFLLEVWSKMNCEEEKLLGIARFSLDLI